MTKFVNFIKHTNVKNIFSFEFVCDSIFFIVSLFYFCQQRAKDKNFVNKQNDNENSSKIIEIKNILKFFESMNKIVKNIAHCQNCDENCIMFRI